MSDNEKRETHADIIAEMHRFAKQHEYDHPDMDTNARGIEDYAYRLEAAHERELAAGGDAAKLREALLEARRFVFTSAHRTDRDLLVTDDEERGPYVLTPKETLVKIDAALAAPPRNCEVGSVEEQVERFREFCDDEKGHREHCRNCRLCNAVDCELAWAQMPYEEGDKE